MTDTAPPAKHFRLYSSQDISNGREKQKLRARNDYNHEQVAPFVYITQVQVKEGTVFEPNPKVCACALPEQVDGEAMYFCEGSLCPCPDDCGKHLLLPGNFHFDVCYDPKKKWYLWSKSDIPGGALLFEYTGVLSEESGAVEKDDYIFGFKYQGCDLLLDANDKGNLARFVSHSCNANCIARMAIFDGTGVPHVLFFARRDIFAGEEVTVDYGDDWWKAKKLKCFCGSYKCRYDGKEGKANADEDEIIVLSSDSEEGVADPHERVTTTGKTVGSGIKLQRARKAIDPGIKLQRARKAIDPGIKLQRARKAIDPGIKLQRARKAIDPGIKLHRARKMIGSRSKQAAAVNARKNTARKILYNS